jgi:Tol biopolymer transport system component
VARIWLKQTAGGGEEPLTEGPDNHPRFSPDGSQILFVRETGNAKSLYRVPVVGGGPRKIVDDVMEADWSPDGNRVAFLRMTPAGEGNLVSVIVTDLRTGAKTTLAEIENRLLYGIRWSPDGSRIAVSETSLLGMLSESSHIVLIDTATGGIERVTVTDWPGAYTSVEWAPDGRSFVTGQTPDVLARVSDSPSQVMEYDIGTATTRGLFWATMQMPMGGRAFSTVAVLDSSRVVVDEHVYRAGLIEVPLAGGPAANGPGKTLTDGLGRDRQPVYSPDGNRIVFSSNRSGNIDLWSFDRTTEEVRQLTDDPAGDWDPAFSPDGSRIIWASNRSGHMEIWIADVDGSGARQVSDDGVDAENPTMTPDGEWIVYQSGSDEKLGVWKIRPDGSDATMLRPGAHLLTEVSPDGRYALFTHVRAMNRVLRVIEADDGDLVPFEIVLPIRKLQQNIMLGRARWTPDSKRIVYIAEDEQGRNGVFVQDFVPGADEPVSRRKLVGFADDYVTESLGVSPDGRSVVVSVMYPRRSLKLAEPVPLASRE